MIDGSSAGKVFGKLAATAGVADCDDHFAVDKWEWPQGVALYALARAALESGSSADLGFLRSWYGRALGGSPPTRNVNTTAPLLALVCLLEREEGPGWRELCSDWAEWTLRGAPRTEEGGIQHVTSHLLNRGELWADTLFMTVLFMAKASRVLGWPELGEDARFQFLLHIRYLADASSGLWFHGWSFEGRHHFGKAHWARGNAWFAMAAVELLELELELASGSGPVRDPSLRTVHEAFLSQARALIRLQADDGLWRTVLDDPESYTETSASAGIAYAWHKAARLGLMGPEFLAAAEMAARGVNARIDEDGTVRGVSHGTSVGWDLEHYRSIREAPTAYGQGLAYLMLTEAERL